MTPIELLKIKQNYYQNIRERVEGILNVQSKQIKKYQLDYEAEIKKTKWSIGQKKDFFKSISEHNVILTGDFHAHIQTTKAILRLARHIGSEKLVIGLESIFVEHQVSLDEYMAGQLTDQDFLKKIEWAKNWGFPWEYTKTLLKWAIQNKVPVVGLNKISIKNLADRDKFSAQMISQTLKRYPDRKMIVQYGEFHLSQGHLPQKIQKISNSMNVSLKVLVVMQSPEKVFFDLMRKGKDPAVIDFVKNNKSRWAMMSVVPWVKWQDYLLFLESGFDRRIKVDDSDFTDHVHQAVLVLKNVLKLNTLNAEDFAVYGVNDETLFDKIESLDKNLRKHYRDLILNGQSFYCPEGDFGFVARPTLNQISKLSAQLVLFKLNVYRKTMIDGQKKFLSLIWLEALTYFLVKLINPKKKTDTFEDIRLALRNENFTDKGKEALTLALEQKMNEVRYASLQDIRGFDRRYKLIRNKKSFFVSSQILGGIMGEKIYYAYKRKHLDWSRQKNFLLRDLYSELFIKAYYESVEIIDSWPASFRSKFDRF
ncbi:MAG: ChaN family lipoprotein [Pseudobdellovibrio sp.]